MKFFVAGASGGVGKLVVADLLAAGHEVVVLVRKAPAEETASAGAHTRTHTVVGDIFKPETFTAAMAGCDVVISALGSRSLKAEGIYSVGISNLVDAMRANKISRLVAVTADHDRADAPFMFRNFVKVMILNDIFADMIKMERWMDGVKDIRWTFVRPQRLMDKPGEEYRIGTREAPPKPGKFEINRAAVARFVADRAWTDEFAGQYISIDGPK